MKRQDISLHPHPVVILSSMLGGQAAWCSTNVQPTWPEGINEGQLSAPDKLLSMDLELDWVPKPVCPFYQVIEIAAQLAGIDPTELMRDPHFCGTWQEYTFHGGCWGGRKKYGSSTAASACATILATLEWQLRIVNGEVVTTVRPKQAIANSGRKPSASQLFRERKGILSRWRQVVFELTCVPVDPYTKEEDEDPHFRRISSADDLEEREIVSKARAIYDALKSQVVGELDPLQLRLGSPTAQHCPVSPRGSHRLTYAGIQSIAQR